VRVDCRCVKMLSSLLCSQVLEERSVLMALSHSPKCRAVRPNVRWLTASTDRAELARWWILRLGDWLPFRN